ncbi:MAG: class E sortase, partial [Actinomycetes bacterium]
MATDTRIRPRRRQAVFWAGIVMILGGVGLLGYLAWELYGTTYVSKERQQRATSRIEEGWG